MSSYFKSLGVAAALSLPLTAGAVTVTVDGTGGTATTFAKLSEAVTYVNANSSEPNIINVTANHTDNAQIEILVPMTINGNAVTPPQIAVSRDAFTAAADIGVADRNYIEVATAGNVVVNDLLIFCIDANYASSTIVNALSLVKPASGVGEYTFNNVTITGSTLGVPIEPTAADPYYSPTARFWYALGATRGAINVKEVGGAGSYNSTFNNCAFSAARQNVVYVSNISGTTEINGGIFSGAGVDVIKVEGATGVSIVGTPTNRVRVSSGNASSGGVEMRVLGNAVIDELSYTDFMNMAARGTAAEPPTGTALQVNGGTITDMNFVRIGNIQQHALHVMTGTVNVSDSTFHANGTANFNNTVQPSPHPVRIDAGTVSFTDSIFTSALAGQVLLNGGTVNFANSALPTDGLTSESLNITTPVTGTPASNTAPVSVSPNYITEAYTLTDTANINFLRPTNPAYATASSEGTFLTGGAGINPSNVSDWQMY